MKEISLFGNQKVNATMLKPEAFGRGLLIKNQLCIDVAATMPLFPLPKRFAGETSDWWMYPAHLDWSLTVAGYVPVRAVHFNTLREVAHLFDAFYVAHEMDKGGEFTEELALAPVGYRLRTDHNLAHGKVRFCAAEPLALAARSGVATTRRATEERYEDAWRKYDPIIIGVIGDGENGMFMPLISWTW